MKMCANVQSAVAPLEYPGLRAVQTAVPSVTVVVSAVYAAAHVGTAAPVVPAVVQENTYRLVTEKFALASARSMTIRAPSATAAELVLDKTPEPDFK